MSAVLRRSSLVVPLALLAVAWLVVVNGASGHAAAGALVETPTPSGGTPNTSPFPPSVPTGLEAVSVTSTSVTLRWVAARPGCCSVEGYDITYNQAFNDIFWQQTVGNVTTVTITSNIRPVSQYTFRVAAHDGLGHRSAASDPVTVVTPLSDTASDRVPPGAPTNLQVGAVTPSTAALTWSPSTDNVAVVGYDVYRFDGVFVSTLVATVSGTSYTAPLGSPRNLFYVRARDAAGNVSIASNLVNAGSTTSSQPGSPSASPSLPPLSCRVTLTGNSQWTGGFVLGLTITNTGTTSIIDWTLTFFFGGDQRVINAWNATFSQTGQSVSMGAASWNRVIPPGGSVSVGLQGTWVTSSAPPTAYFLNGVRCATG